MGEVDASTNHGIEYGQHESQQPRFFPRLKIDSDEIDTVIKKDIANRQFDSLNMLSQIVSYWQSEQISSTEVLKELHTDIATWYEYHKNTRPYVEAYYEQKETGFEEDVARWRVLSDRRRILYKALESRGYHIPSRTSQPQIIIQSSESGISSLDNILGIINHDIGSPTEIVRSYSSEQSANLFTYDERVHEARWGLRRLIDALDVGHDIVDIKPGEMNTSSILSRIDMALSNEIPDLTIKIEPESVLLDNDLHSVRQIHRDETILPIPSALVHVLARNCAYNSIKAMMDSCGGVSPDFIFRVQYGVSEDGLYRFLIFEDNGNGFPDYFLEHGFQKGISIWGGQQGTGYAMATLEKLFQIYVHPNTTFIPRNILAKEGHGARLFVQIPLRQTGNSS